MTCCEIVYIHVKIEKRLSCLLFYLLVFFSLFTIVISILFPILFVITIRMWFLIIGPVVGRKAHSGPMTCFRSSLPDPSEWLRKNDRPFARIGSDVLRVVDRLPILQRVPLLNLAKDLATFFIEIFNYSYAKREHTTTEITWTIRISLHIQTL